MLRLVACLLGSVLEVFSGWVEGLVPVWLVLFPCGRCLFLCLPPPCLACAVGRFAAAFSFGVVSLALDLLLGRGAEGVESALRLASLLASCLAFCLAFAWLS